MLNLSQNDQLALEQHGLSISQLELQLQQLRQGVPPLNLVRPCYLGDGIIQFSPKELHDYRKQFQVAHDNGRISKFIPASGAATRMFKDLLQFIEEEQAQTRNEEHLGPPEGIKYAWEQLSQFPFIEELLQYVETHGMKLEDHGDSQHISQVFRQLLHTPGLGYANLPKALLPFHRYSDGTRTSLEEHVREAMMYTKKAGDTVRIHLTVSAQFETLVQDHIETIRKNIAQNGNNIELTVSIQKSSTDTIALDVDQQLFRDAEGHVIFRPGGHGALLENLNDCQGDIVCISNIDNVVPDYLKRPIIEWRMSLAGYLLTLQEKIFHHLQQLVSPQPTIVKNTAQFIRDDLHYELPTAYDRMDIPAQVEELTRFLDRPLRVCGVVSNTGEAGGGPFWVQHANGFQSRQIVEQSQADPQSEKQQQLFTTATHFNPVDLVCGVRNRQSVPFNLLKFRDPNTGFIAQKTYQSRPLKALEWPGLWNGGMADWITLFVEVPRSTFNPVKTFLDWLNPSHQPSA